MEEFVLNNLKPIYNRHPIFKEHVLIFSYNLDIVKLGRLKENRESVVVVVSVVVFVRWLVFEIMCILGFSDCLCFLLLAKFSARRIVSNN